MGAVFTNFLLPMNNDGNVTISLEPPTPISGWTIQCDLLQYFNGTPIFSTYYSNASGIANGASGITVVNPTFGIFRLYFPSILSSGYQQGNYPYNCYRVSGDVQMTRLAYGYVIRN